LLAGAFPAGRTTLRVTSSDHAHTTVILKSAVSDRVAAPRRVRWPVGPTEELVSLSVSESLSLRVSESPEFKGV
jgi:hypothetical protein